MIAPPPPARSAGIDWTDLGDMLELRAYDIGWDRWHLRWDTMKGGERIAYTPADWWSPAYGDAYPRLEAMRDRAREVLRNA